MCNHVYTADHSNRPRSIGKRCPYPEIFALHEPPGSTAGYASGLPVDSTGACIFHSHDLAWKRENGFAARFSGLIPLLDAHGIENFYDFVEFVFVGAPVTTKHGTPDYLLRVEDVTFHKQAYFIAARFADAVEIERVDFPNGVEFDGASFLRELTVAESGSNGFGMAQAQLARVRFSKVEFRSYALFAGARFSGTATGANAVIFRDSIFRGLTDFSGALFELQDDSTTTFERVRFEEFTDFRSARFRCHVEFRFVTFADIADFIDTSFHVVRSSARYVGAAAEFTGISVPSTGALTFMSSDPQRKLFEHDVEMRFIEAELAGTVRFENVNLSHFIPSSRDGVMELARLGRVQIGPGCIKYRLQTEVRSVSVEQGNAPLVVELCQTFTNYFTASQGINLGFEIVSRDKGKVSFFYFTDEDISEAVFLDRLEHTERNLWNLLAVGPDDDVLAIAGPGGAAASPAGESAVVNFVDGVSALFGTFFRVGVRIALGRWKERDTRALLEAIRFNDTGADVRVAILHQTLTARYTGTMLMNLNRLQNAQLPPIAPASPAPAGPEKVRILFVAANSTTRPLDLELEISRIESNLRMGKEGERLELRLVLAATVDRFMDAMLADSPAIVHFSGHGKTTGIIMRDEVGEPRLVPGEALASLFQLFRDNIRCVVLNSCFSLDQARAIRRYVPHVVGMSNRILDHAALAFSTGFYKAIGAGRDVEFAFEMGKTRVQMEAAGGEELMVLL